jgi:hypothetical protein
VIPAGLAAATLKAYQATLASHHEIDVQVTIQDLSGNSLSNVSGLLLDGQVNVDADADITRTATVTLLDPNRSLPFDSDSPSDGALYLDRMIHINYGVLVNGAWVRVPVFTGPVSKLDRSDATINVEAQGKETLAAGGVWAPMALHTGVRKTSAIASLLQSRAGETRFSIPDLASVLTGPISLGRADPSWPTAQRIARSLNRQLFYDGDGICRLRSFPTTTTFTFTEQLILSRPQISYSTDGLANTVIVHGGAQKGPGTVGANGAQPMAMAAINYTAVAASTHPLSPTRLGRNGVARHLIKVVDDTTITNTPAAIALANSTLASALLQAVDASFETLPVPHLEPLDMCTLNTQAGATTFALRKFSLPLVAGPNMTVGFLRNLAVKPRRINR